MYKVLITDPLDQQGIDLLEETGEIEVIYKPKVPLEEYIDDVGVIHGWIIRSGTKIGKELFVQADNLRVVGRAGVGVDNIDLESATLRGVVVMNTPTGNTNAAAEHTLTLMLAAARRVAPAYLSLRNGKWEREKFVGRELRDKTLGIIGLGRIGQEVSSRARSFDMECIGYDPFLSQDKFAALDIRPVELDELFKTADVITAHVPRNENTLNMISDKQIDGMKDGVILVNCARGGIYNEDAVVRGLESGKIGAIGFDVFVNEPLGDHPFLKYDNALVTPHLGASTVEAKENVAVDICSQVRDFLLKDKVKNAVNIPIADFSKLKQLEPFLDLAERLGHLQVVLSEGAIQEVRVNVNGEFDDVKPITLSAMKGLLTPISGDKVNLINAALLAKQRDIKVRESYTYDDSSYANLIEIVVKTEKGERRVKGSLFGKNHPRIVSIDEFHMDVPPIGHVLMIRNKDVPGVIGRVGNFLAARDINIAEYRLGRRETDNTALAMVNLDSELDEESLASLSKEDNILSVQQVNFS